MFRTLPILITALVLTLMLFGMLLLCSNNPWPAAMAGSNTYYTFFQAEFKTFDPAVSFYQHESDITLQIYESPLCYHYLKRPYELEPSLLQEIPAAVYYDKKGLRMDSDDPPADQVGRVEYVGTLKKGILYQPHPCFAKNSDGSAMYRDMTSDLLPEAASPNQFPVKGTRELRAEDIGVQLRRICDMRLASPVYSTFNSFILGMETCSDSIREAVAAEESRARGAGVNVDYYPVNVNYAAIPFAGFEVLDNYTFKVVLKRKYPQLIFWMTMQFFSPIPQEALDFYSQPELIDRQIVLKNYPVGTGAFMIDECKPQQRITMLKNPNYKHGFYPVEGAPGDKEAGLLVDAGKPLPFIDRIVMASERETVPAWMKFLQGYYDNSGIPPDAFDNAVSMGTGGDMNLSDDMATHGITLHTAIAPSIFYFAFNMDDPVVGGYSEEQCKLRQAISIVLDYNEYLEIFLNGRGKSAQSLLPPGFYGSKEGKESVNPFTDMWDPVRKQPVRQGLDKARQLMAEAGYPSGFGSDGKRLVVYHDHALGGRSEFKAQLTWMRQKLAKLGIDLQERPSDLNRYRDKCNTGHWATSMTGWVGDYPDPENFFFLFDGNACKRINQGNNLCNYRNPEFDRWFRILESTKNGPKRLEAIAQADSILQHDAPVCFGYYPPVFTLIHSWLYNYKPMPITRGTLRYYRLDPETRMAAREQWNKPRILPVIVAWLILMAAVLPVLIMIARRRQAEEEMLGSPGGTK